RINGQILHGPVLESLEDLLELVFSFQFSDHIDLVVLRPSNDFLYWTADHEGEDGPDCGCDRGCEHPFAQKAGQRFHNGHDVPIPSRLYTIEYHKLLHFLNDILNKLVRLTIALNKISSVHENAKESKKF